MIRERLNQITSLLYPATCVCCQSSLSRSPKYVEDDFVANWCDDCWGQIPESWCRGCPRCAALIARPIDDDCCSLCRDTVFRFDSSVSVGNYQGMLKRLVLDLKGSMNESLTLQLGRLLGDRILRREELDSVDLLVPVPIHWRRRFSRGFHAAGVIAEGVRSMTGIAVGDVLQCERLTEKQGTLTGPKRFSNVKGAFRLRSLVSLEGSHVVLVDDVMTSGATLSELAGVLKKAGAASVHCAVLARGIGSFKEVRGARRV